MVLAQFQWRKQHYVIKLKFWPSLLALLVLAGLLSLGVWQLQRYQYKQGLLNTYQQGRQRPILAFNGKADGHPVAYQRVQLSGYFINNFNILLDNQIHQGKIGYDVITPVKLPDTEKVMLVDRGWVEKSLIGQLPALPSQLVSFQGMVFYPNLKQFILGKNIYYPDKRPLIIQRIDFAALSKITNYQFYPFILRLSPQAKNGFLRDWQITTMPPSRHMGYAVQWLLMALVFILAFLGFCCQKQEGIAADE